MEALFRSSKVHFRIRKPVCKLSIWLASLSSGASHSLCLQTSLWILKWTFEFWTSQRTSELRNEVRNITVKSYLKSTVSDGQTVFMRLCCVQIIQGIFKHFCTQGPRSNFWTEGTECWASYGARNGLGQWVHWAEATAIGMLEFKTFFTNWYKTEKYSISSSKWQYCS